MESKPLVPLSNEYREVGWQVDPLEYIRFVGLGWPGEIQRAGGEVGEEFGGSDMSP